jgi:hypothetical protein
MAKRLINQSAPREPRLPPGAVRGDVSKQVFCTAHYEPKYFYLDETRTCVQCGAAFTFAASEQKFWYERLKFNFRSVPIRCLACRRQRRSEHALREEVANARAEVRRCADDPRTQLALARAIVELFRKTGTGSLDEAIAAARRVAVPAPGAPVLGRRSPYRGESVGERPRVPASFLV